MGALLCYHLHSCAFCIEVLPLISMTRRMATAQLGCRLLPSLAEEIKRMLIVSLNTVKFKICEGSHPKVRHLKDTIESKPSASDSMVFYYYTK